MNRQATIFVLIALALSVTTGCSKKSNQTPGTMSASVNGTTFTAGSVIGSYSPLDRMITLVGFSVSVGDTTELSIFVPDSVAVNTPVSFSSGAAVFYYDSKTQGFYDGDEIDGHGSVTLATLDTLTQTVSGSFTGVLISSTGDSVSVTGQFNSGYVSGTP